LSIGAGQDRQARQKKSEAFALPYMYPRWTISEVGGLDGLAMIYVKSILAGIAAVLLVVVLFVVAVFVIPLLLQFRTGSGGIGAVSGGLSTLALLAIVALAFAGGFYWEFRRASRAKSGVRR
jgi:hypothetical protein